MRCAEYARVMDGEAVHVKEIKVAKFLTLFLSFDNVSLACLGLFR